MRMERKTAEKVLKEITGLHNGGISNIAFYDDALLYRSEEYAVPLLESIIESKISAYFHTPNGLHAKYVTPKIAQLLKASGFVMPRISLETSDGTEQVRTGAKVTNEEFKQAASYFKEAGYKEGAFIAYLMFGLPGQSPGCIQESIKFANHCGARISLSEYSPIPHTKDWQRIENKLPSADPPWHNNSVYPLLNASGRLGALKIKLFAKELNNCFT
jgi:radical SAM superfamily enzyme YgiQ (UPF0313 family)